MDLTSVGPIHELDAGRYRAVVRNGVPMIERTDTVGAVTAVVVPISRPLFSELSADWSPPVQFKIHDGQFVFRTVEEAPGSGRIVVKADPTLDDRC